MSISRTTDQFTGVFTVEQRQRIDQKWKASSFKGRPPSTYLGKLKTLHDAGVDVSDCHSIPDYGTNNIPQFQRDLADDNHCPEAYEEWRALKRADAFNMTHTGEVCVGTDSFGNDIFEVQTIPKEGSEESRLESVREARRDGQKQSVANRRSIQRADDLIERYKSAHPAKNGFKNRQLLASKIAEWGIQQRLYRADKKRNLVSQLRNRGVS